MKHSLLIYLFIMVLVTNLIRVLPMTLIRRRITHPFLRSFLYYVPYVTLAVMTFPAIMQATSSPWGGFIALLFGIVAAWFGWGLFPVATVCCIVAFVCEIL